MLFLTFALLLVGRCLGDVVDTLAADPKASTLVQLINKVGLAPALKTGMYTILAPTDDAFAKLPVSTLTSLLTNNTVLYELLKNHVVAKSVDSKDITNELKVATLTGEKIRFNVYSHNSVITVNGVNISQADLMANNGVIHFIDDIITPATKTVVQLVAEDPELTTLLTAMTVAHIAVEFQHENFTLFAPTDAAFANMVPARLQALMDNPTYLKEVIEFHGVQSTIYSAGFYDRETLTTIDTDGDVILIKVDGSGETKLTVREAKVTVADIVSKNGVIHKIDKVLLPHSVSNWLASTIVG